MRIAVQFQDQRLDFEVPEDRLIGHRSGPEAATGLDAPAMARRAIESPSEFPPLARAVVPGDRVALAIDPTTPDLPAILEVVASTLGAAQVAAIEVISTAPEPPSLPSLVTWTVHDPDDRDQVAYLATTSEGHRVYLNRHLTDADIVIPIGTLDYDASLGYRGPWSALYPSLSDRETLARFRSVVADGAPDRSRPSASLRESKEVSWLLGCQFHLGVLPGASGPSRVVAGLESAVFSEGTAAVDGAWTFRVEDRADLVVAGVGSPGRSTSIDDLAEGVATAARLVRRGGKIVVLSRAKGEVGPAFRRLVGAENPRAALARLRGREADPDYPAARKLAEALAWADVYLHSALDPDLVDDLAMIPIDRPEEARKLVASAASCILLAQAERTRALVAGEVEAAVPSSP